MGTAIAQSKLFGAKTPQEAIALMLVAQSEGLHPARAAIEYHIIQGRPALKADAMLARFQQQGGSVKWTSYTDEKVEGEFSHPQGGSVTIDWTIDRAKQAGVYGKNPTWRSYPRAMLRARCISEGIRTVFPGVSVGVYTPEEVADFDPPERDITPTKAAPMPDKVKAQAEQMRAAKAAKSPAKAPEKPVIEGTATVVDDPGLPAGSGDLSDFMPQPIQPDTLDKLAKAFLGIGYEIPDVEEKYGKNCDEWSESDLPKLRALFAELNAEAHAAATDGEVV